MTRPIRELLWGRRLCDCPGRVRRRPPGHGRRTESTETGRVRGSVFALFGIVTAIRNVVWAVRTRVDVTAFWPEAAVVIGSASAQSDCQGTTQTRNASSS